MDRQTDKNDIEQMFSSHEKKGYSAIRCEETVF